MIKLTGPTEGRPDPDARVPINIAPGVREDLRKLLVHAPEMRGVGYSEFVQRATNRAWEELGALTHRESVIDPNTMPPRPWRVVPPIPGSRAFIRSADDKTVTSQCRSEDVAQFICEAVNAYDPEDS